MNHVIHQTICSVTNTSMLSKNRKHHKASMDNSVSVEKFLSKKVLELEIIRLSRFILLIQSPIQTSLYSIGNFTTQAHNIYRNSC